MPEKMRTRADKLAARAKEKRELRSDRPSSPGGAMALGAAGAGSRFKAGLGGEWPGREKLATKPPMPTAVGFQSHFVRDCAGRVQQMITRRTECGLCA